MSSGASIPYTAVTKNLLKQLARGERVGYRHLELWKEGEKLILRGKTDQGEVELHFMAERGETFGLSIGQIRRIVALEEKPLYRTTLRKGSL